MYKHEGGLVAALFTSNSVKAPASRYRQSVRNALREIAPAGGFCLTALTHIILMLVSLSLNMHESSWIQAIEEQKILVVMFGVFALTMTCLAWGLLLKPGVHTKMNL